jgi:flagellar hook-basal body complex protein FliE
MSDLRLNAINQMRQLDQVTPQINKSANSIAPEKSFEETLSKYINEANDMQIQADNDVKKIIAGEDIDAHEVMTAVEKASMSFEMVMEIRNKMLEAYRDIIKTPM